MRSAYAPEENIYRRINLELNSQQIVYHVNDSVSRLYFSIPNENLVYKKPDTSSWFYAHIRVKYAVLSAEKTKKVMDTGSVWISDRSPEKITGRDIKGSVNMKIKPGELCTVDAVIYDLNRKVKNNKLVWVDKTSTGTRQNFLLRNSNGEVLYDYYLTHGSEVIVSSERNSKNSFVVDLFKAEFQPAKAPFNSEKRKPFELRPDTSFTVAKENGNIKITVPYTGFLHLKAGNDLEGLTIFGVDETYPGLKNSTDMIKCTVYLMAHDEYKNCLEAPNQKAAIDQFWREIGASTERAKELLKRYYSRVMLANKLFTSHQPGWQTDRGMIYIIYSAPTTMYKTAGGELWIYGNDIDPNSIRFNFQKVLNPFTENDFVLERNDYNSELYRRSWHDMVNGSWREGHIHLDN